MKKFCCYWIPISFSVLPARSEFPILKKKTATIINILFGFKKYGHPDKKESLVMETGIRFIHLTNLKRPFAHIDY